MGISRWAQKRLNPHLRRVCLNKDTPWTNLMPTFLLRLYSQTYQNQNEMRTQRQEICLRSKRSTSQVLDMAAFYIRLFLDFKTGTIKLTLRRETRISQLHPLPSGRFSLWLTSLLSWQIQLTSIGKVKDVSMQGISWHDRQAIFCPWGVDFKSAQTWI